MSKISYSVVTSIIFWVALTGEVDFIRIYANLGGSLQKGFVIQRLLPSG